MGTRLAPGEIPTSRQWGIWATKQVLASCSKRYYHKIQYGTQTRTLTGRQPPMILRIWRKETHPGSLRISHSQVRYSSVSASASTAPRTPLTPPLPSSYHPQRARHHPLRQSHSGPARCPTSGLAGVCAPVEDQILLLARANYHSSQARCPMSDLADEAVVQEAAVEV